MDDALFDARVNDTFTLTERTSVPHYLGFLTPSQAERARSILSKTAARFEFSGGYAEAERRMLACLPDWCDSPDYPICAYTLSYRECDKLTHRDFLGAIMALGITRECVGDILVESGRAVVFLSSEISGYVVSQLGKVGNVGVNVAQGFCEPLPGAGEKAQFCDTIASARLDCVVGAVCSVSRKTACEIIEQGMVAVNSFACQKATRLISSGDRLTVRGRGRLISTRLMIYLKKEE